MIEDKKASADWAIEETPTLRDQTTTILREAILDETFAPGDKLVERTLADRTGVSRTSIREALAQLEAEGLVTRLAGRGMRVAQLTVEDARAIYEARAILESAMARLFVERATKKNMAELDRAVQEAVQSDTPGTARKHASNLDQVFDVITRGAGNEITWQMASVLRTRVTYLRTITSRVASSERRVESIHLLEDIRKALLARDGDRAEQLIRGYVERSAAFAMQVLASMNKQDTGKQGKQ